MPGGQPGASGNSTRFSAPPHGDLPPPSRGRPRAGRNGARRDGGGGMGDGACGRAGQARAQRPQQHRGPPASPARSPPSRFAGRPPIAAPRRTAPRAGPISGAVPGAGRCVGLAAVPKWSGKAGGAIFVRGGGQGGGGRDGGGGGRLLLKRQRPLLPRSEGVFCRRAGPLTGRAGGRPSSLNLGGKPAFLERGCAPSPARLTGGQRAKGGGRFKGRGRPARPRR